MQDTLGSILSTEKKEKKIPVVGLDKNVEKQNKAKTKNTRRHQKVLTRTFLDVNPASTPVNYRSRKHTWTLAL